MIYFAAMQIIKNLRAVIWDMGGVLLRTIDWTPRSMLAKRFGMTDHELMDLVFHSDTAVKAEIGQLSYAEYWNGVMKKLGVDEKALSWFMGAFFQGDQFDWHLMKIIRYLRVRYKTGLLSNALPGTRVTLGKKYDFLDDFDDAIFSYEVGLRKPDERIYQLAARRLGIAPEEAVFIDDMPENVDGALKAGMNGLVFINESQVISEFGYLTGIENHH